MVTTNSLNQTTKAFVFTIPFAIGTGVFYAIFYIIATLALPSDTLVVMEFAMIFFLCMYLTITSFLDGLYPE